LAINEIIEGYDMIDLNLPETSFALAAVRQAALLVKQVQAELADSDSLAMTKLDCSPVTVGDLAAQALVGRLLGQAFPEECLVAEEEAGILTQAGGRAVLETITHFVARFAPEARPQLVCGWIDRGRAAPGRRFWTLDPIDGTKGYLRGDQYAVALALVVDGVVQTGALGCPNLADAYRPDVDGEGALIIAARGQGAWTTSLAAPGQYEKLQVSQRSDPTQARILRSYEEAHTNVGQLDRLAHLLGVRAEPVRMDSQAKYAVLAAGKGDAILRLLSQDKPDYREKIWDQAAGSIIVEEAGGKVSDLSGKPLDFRTGRQLERNRGVLATNGRLHAAFLEALEKISNN
jgi:3'(2'), 5'-bisphosphate nucleotidase